MKLNRRTGEQRKNGRTKTSMCETNMKEIGGWGWGWRKKLGMHGISLAPFQFQNNFPENYYFSTMCVDKTQHILIISVRQKIF